MFAALALASAAFYGAADFIGGFTARRADTLVVVVISQFAGMVVVALSLPFLPSVEPSASDWMWGAIAGVTGGAGVALLYRALAVGVMAVVAPVTAVCAVVVPVASAIALGERPGLQSGAGILLAVAAIALVSRSEPDVSRAAPDASAGARSALGLAIAAGIAIGLFFLALARTSREAGMWPLLTARIVSVALFGAATMIGRRSYRLPRRVLSTAIAGGIVDMLANVLYLLAARSGPLTLVVTLSSLYPASTVLLAWMILGERITTWQWVGVGLALIAIVAIVSA
jgi:uncharacterized membrane protein